MCAGVLLQSWHAAMVLFEQRASFNGRQTGFSRRFTARQALKLLPASVCILGLRSACSAVSLYYCCRERYRSIIDQTHRARQPFALQGTGTSPLTPHLGSGQPRHRRTTLDLTNKRNHAAPTLAHRAPARACEVRLPSTGLRLGPVSYTHLTLPTKA